MGMGIKRHLALAVAFLFLTDIALGQSGIGGHSGGLGTPPPKAQMEGQSHARAFTKLIFDDGALVYNGSHVHVTTSASSPALVNGYVPYSGAIKNLNMGSYDVTATNFFGKIDNQHPEYTPMTVYGIHTHPQYSPVNHQHGEYVTLNQTVPQHILGKPIFEGIQFDTNTHVGATAEGKMYWDSIYHTPSVNLNSNVNLQVGQETLIRVVAGENLADGDVVYFSGSTGAFPTAMKAIANSTETGRVKGLATEAITAGNQGFVCNFGIIHDLDTSAFNAGDLVYLSGTTAGAITASRPLPPLQQIVVGRVVVKDTTNGSIYRSSSPNYPISGDQVDLQRETTVSAGVTSKHSLQDWYNTYSVGEISGGTITAIGPTHVTVSAGTGISATGSLDTDPVAFMDWDYVQLTMTDQRVNWIAVDYNGGAPHVQVHVGTSASDYSVPTDINYQDVFPLGYVTKNGAELYLTNNPRRIQDAPGGLIRRFYQTLPLARDEKLGGLILGETGTRNITLTAGKLWDRQNSFTINVLNTSTGSVFSTWYRDGGTGFVETEGVTQWPNGKYDDGSGVLADVTSTPQRYANLWWYLSTEGQLAMVYGRNLYTSAGAASAGSPPATLPLPLNAHFRLIGRTTFVGGGATFTANDSVFNNTFTASAVTNHNNLSGLQGGTTSEYYHLTSAQNTAVGTYSPSFSFYDTQTKQLSQHQHPNYSTSGGYGVNTAHPEYVPFSVYGIHDHPQYSTSGGYGVNTAHPEYVPFSVYGIHTHPEYATVGFVSHTHAEATASAAGFVEALSGVATQYYDGSGNWSVPAGSGSSSGGVSYQSLAYPQALQGIEQLRHTVGSYNQYGNIVVDGFQDQTGVTQTTGFTYTGASLYNYALTVGDGSAPTGGTITTSGGKTIHTFKLADSGTNFVVPTGASGTVEVLVVGGGGGGGVGDSAGSPAWSGGGGGAGGIQYNASYSVTGGNYTVTVGDGGAGATADTSKGVNGGNSVFGTLTATGGGGGGSTSVDTGDGTNGGSGGGGAPQAGASTGGTGSQGQNGGNGANTLSGWNGSGGGGGDTAAGTNGTTDAGAAGGNGTSYSISGGAVTYAGGGGGGGLSGAAAGGGTGGGGTGGVKTGSVQATAGTDDLGGGGGGGGNEGTVNGKDGGSGVVIVSYTTGSLSVTSMSSGYVHSIAHPFPYVPTHLGVSLKLDSALVNGQHYYLTASVSRDGGTSFTSLHPIVKAGQHGYYYASMASVAGQPSGSNVVAKVGLANQTTAKLKGYSIYGE